MHWRTWKHGSIQVQLAILLADVVLSAAGVLQPLSQPLCHWHCDCIADQGPSASLTPDHAQVSAMFANSIQAAKGRDANQLGV